MERGAVRPTLDWRYGQLHRECQYPTGSGRTFAVAGILHPVDSPVCLDVQNEGGHRIDAWGA